MITNVRITVKGRVQNVGFRYFTFKTANTFNIKGLVKNEMDGSVYIEAEGEEPDVELFIEQIKQGPSWAIIRKTEISSAPVMNYTDFIVK
ncbi:MAG: acylphosphatase [Bacteroidales bacterium]|nr:acylphosphatase [Bacteroidales bacterium]